MAREISRAETYERAHEVFSQINFTSFDFNTIKESLLNYTKLYFPEDFNDYIESSEYISILELFAYVGELLSYRIDINSHENFITTAQRKESILRLAKLISYKASRNLPARGLVKMTSIQTTEAIFDSQGRNLANRKIVWNDSNNPDWKEQFLLIMNRILEQEFGTVSPNERRQVDDVLFELYTLNNNSLSPGGKSVFSYNTTVSGQSVPMEVVPVRLTEFGPEEKRPEVDAKFSLLYANDGLGDSSDTTGFLFFTKQGTLQRTQVNFDGITPNQTFDIETDNINETDVYINNVDPDTRQILINNPYADTLPHLVSSDLRFGEWIEVDLANAQNILFNTNSNRHKYEIETLDKDQVRLVFGDGEFSEIPNGAFDIWYRTSINDNIAIPKSAITGQSSTFTYNDVSNNVQTVTFSFSLINSLQNGSAAESIEHIRRVAPSVYYTQDRMVNARDYNVFPLQNPSILKMRTVNRTFAGDSKYIAWHDGSESYEDVKLFGDDLALFWNEQEPENGGLIIVSTPVGSSQLINQTIEPLLSSTDFFSIIGPELENQNENPAGIRRSFNAAEVTDIINALDLAAVGSLSFVDLYYAPDVSTDEWTIDPHPSADSIFMVRIEPTFSISSLLSGWNIRYRTKSLICNSQTTRFWNTNNTNQVINFDTFNTVTDKIIVLKANVDSSNTTTLDSNREYGVLGQPLLEQNLPNAGLPDINSLSILPADINEDGIPDNLLQPLLFDFTFEEEYTAWLSSPGGSGTTLILPNSRKYITTFADEDIEVYVQEEGTGSFVRYTFADGHLTASGTSGIFSTEITFTGSGLPVPDADDVIRIIFKDYVYFSRETAIDRWVPQQETDAIKILFSQDTSTIEDERLYKRHEGRFPLNFAWFHFTPRFNLVDPSPTNINDMFIVTSGYYNSLVRYLNNQTDNKPTLPTSFELKNTYAELLDNKMISDTVILHPGKFKILFGSRAPSSVQASFKVIRPTQTNLTDNEVKVRIVEIIRNFFNIDQWEFGEIFYFTELSAAIHAELGPEIDSIVIVPLYSQTQFGDLFQIQAQEDELFIADITTSDIEIVEAFTPENLRQN